MELYHFNLSVCSQKVRLCLAEKGIDYVSKPVDLMKLENVSADYLKINPNGVVPTLVHDGRIVIESSIIIEYLDDAFPDRPLRPKDPYDRAAMRLWMRREDDAALPSVGVLSLQKLIKPFMQMRDHAEIEHMLEVHPDRERANIHAHIVNSDIPEAVLTKAEADLAGLVEKIDAALEGREWLAGPDYSLAELTWLPFFDRMVLLGLDRLWTDRPNVGAWLSRMKARPSYEAAILAFNTI